MKRKMMNNYPPYYYDSRNMPQGGMPPMARTPFDVPKLRSPLGSIKKAGLLGGVKKLNLSSLIDTSSKAINTFNQMIPLYREVKPVLENTKSVAQTLKKAFVKPKNTNRKKDNEVIEPEVLEGASVKLKKPKTKKVEPETKVINDDKPHKPFF